MNPPQQITRLHGLVHELKVGYVMTRSLVTVDPKAPLRSLRELLLVNRISGLPVIDKGELVGIISLEDFIRALADRQHYCTIGDKMSRDVDTLCEDDPLVWAIDKFEKTGLGRFPVVERGTLKLVGIVTKGDVIKGLLKKFESRQQEEERQGHRSSHIFEDIEADSTTLTFQYEVAGKDFKQAGESSSRLKRTLNRLGIRRDIVRRLAIASYEAEINLVIYSEGGKIRVQVEPSRVLVEVDDAGPGITDLDKAMQPGYSTASDWVRELGFGAGMGLPNMQSMSDEFDIASSKGKGTHLKMAFFTPEVQHET